MEHLKKFANYTVKEFMHSLMGWSLAIMIITIISLLIPRLIGSSLEVDIPSRFRDNWLLRAFKNS